MGDGLRLAQLACPEPQAIGPETSRARRRGRGWGSSASAQVCRVRRKRPRYPAVRARLRDDV